jgi:hypothetical protein
MYALWGLTAEKKYVYKDKMGAYKIGRCGMLAAKGTYRPAELSKRLREQ